MSKLLIVLAVALVTAPLALGQAVDSLPRTMDGGTELILQIMLDDPTHCEVIGGDRMELPDGGVSFPLRILACDVGY